jgi:hypothetical protein
LNELEAERQEREAFRQQVFNSTQFGGLPPEVTASMFENLATRYGVSPYTVMSIAGQEVFRNPTFQEIGDLDEDELPAKLEEFRNVLEAALERLR